MQKKIIALAVAALASSAAFAQSNVTVYGIADAYLASSKTDQAARTNLVQSGGLAGSRLGFKGVEDLGNGLKALFVMETAINLDAGAGAAGLLGSTRQSMVGLTGGFGTAVAGRLQTAAYDWAVKYDVLAGTAFSPLQNVTGTSTLVSNGAGVAGKAPSFLIGGTAIATRSDNAIAYISPTFSGLTLAYNHGEVTEQATAPLTVGGNNVHADLFGADYAMGPVAVGGVYARVKNDATLTKTGDWSLGATYDLKVAKLGATYQRSKVDVNGNAANADSAWSMGVVVPVSAAGNMIASYAKNSIKSTAADDDTKSWTLAYTHSLSKRTTAYAGYNSISRNNGVNVTVTGYQNGPAANLVSGADTGTFVVGMNHKF